mmetsp:Transcript_34679/g.87632  ORF Transcript_34679/g.87632 Transcript_34679/m.87632 type:complete len:218 (-) Transcript_34679:337-990(-)
MPQDACGQGPFALAHQDAGAPVREGQGGGELRHPFGRRQELRDARQEPAHPTVLRELLGAVDDIGRVGQDQPDAGQRLPRDRPRRPGAGQLRHRQRDGGVQRGGAPRGLRVDEQEQDQRHHVPAVPGQGLKVRRPRRVRELRVAQGVLRRAQVRAVHGVRVRARLGRAGDDGGDLEEGAHQLRHVRDPRLREVHGGHLPGLDQLHGAGPRDLHRGLR